MIHVIRAFPHSDLGYRVLCTSPSRPGPTCGRDTLTSGGVGAVFIPGRCAPSGAARGDHAEALAKGEHREISASAVAAAGGASTVAAAGGPIGHLKQHAVDGRVFLSVKA